MVVGKEKKRVVEINSTLLNKKKKTCTVFLSSYRSTSESLGEQEIKNKKINLLTLIIIM